MRTTSGMQTAGVTRYKRDFSKTHFRPVGYGRVTKASGCSATRSSPLRFVASQSLPGQPPSPSMPPPLLSTLLAVVAPPHQHAAAAACVLPSTFPPSLPPPSSPPPHSKPPLFPPPASLLSRDKCETSLPSSFALRPAGRAPGRACPRGASGRRYRHRVAARARRCRE